MQDPILSKYYGSMGQIEAYWNGAKWDAIEQEMGPDVWDQTKQYWFLKDTGQDYKAYAREVGLDIEKYNTIGDQYDQVLANTITEFGSQLQNPEFFFRDRYAPQGQTAMGAEALAGGMQGMPEPGLPQLSWPEWQDTLGESLSNLVADYTIDGEPMPSAAMYRLSGISADMGLPNEWVLLELASRSVPQ
jgi:hypothetical protein